MKIGSLAVAPAALLGIFTVSALAAGAVVTISATSLFQSDPQGVNFNGNIETVLPSTVQEIGAVTVPAFGQVQAWGATTKPGGFCFGLKMPDGSWGGNPLPASLPAGNGWDGGTVPGCFQTQQQQALMGGGSTGQALESWDTLVRNTSGQTYVIYVGFVEAEGAAAFIRDSATGVTASVSNDGYYVLAEPAPVTPAPANAPAGTPSEVPCGACDEQDLEVANAAGRKLLPDYTPSGLASGYLAGPTRGTN